MDVYLALPWVLKLRLAPIHFVFYCARSPKATSCLLMVVEYSLLSAVLTWVSPPQEIDKPVTYYLLTLEQDGMASTQVCACMHSVSFINLNCSIEHNCFHRRGAHTLNILLYLTWHIVDLSRYSLNLLAILPALNCRTYCLVRTIQ